MSAGAQSGSVDLAAGHSRRKGETRLTALSTSTAYDQVPYPCYAYWFTHPDNLFIIASLLGLSPTPVQQCRVLELGCANGGNLIPMAFQLPESRFFGIDVSSRQIADGLERISTLGLSNIELESLDILDVSADIGVFDTIICHGVFSWVSDEVREKIFEICQRNLAPHGVALISYNVYPGWHQGDQLREMFRYHTSGESDPNQRVKAAKRLLRQLVDVATQVGTTSESFLQSEISRLEQLDDEYLLFEYLEGEMRPLYFHQFAAQAESFGLQYLGSAWRGRMSMDDQHPSVAEALARYDDPIEAQQYLDFFTNARFRASLLCRAEKKVGQNLAADSIYRGFLRANVRPDPAGGDLASPNPVEIATPTGEATQIWGPSIRIALSILTDESPALVSFERLFELVVERLVETGFGDLVQSGGEIDTMRRELGANLTRLYLANIVHFQCRAVQVANHVSECPSVTRLAVLEAERGEAVTNQWHESIFFDPFFRAVLSRLDGTMDVSALARVLDRAIRKGDVEPPSALLRSPTRSDIERAVQSVLAQLRDDALLVG